MPFPIKSLEQLIDEACSDMEAALVQVAEANGYQIAADAIARSVRSPHGMLYHICVIQASAIWAAHQHHRWNGDQLIADTAEFEALRLHAASYGIFPRAATRAIGRVTFEGDEGVVIPAGLLLRSAANSLYEVDAAVTIGADGAATATVRALASGEIGNLPAGYGLALVSPLAGLDDQVATVDSDGLTGGAAEETALSLLDRYLTRKREVPQGGAAHDYPAWVKNEFAVAKVKTLALQGTCRDIAVGVVVAMGTADAPRVPTPAELDAISRHLGRINGPDGLRPVTADVEVSGADIQQLPLRIGIAPDTAGVRAAVTAAYAAFMAREAEIGERLSFSRLSEALSAAAGEYRHILIEPGRDVLPGETTLLTPGPITWGAA